MDGSLSCENGNFPFIISYNTVLFRHTESVRAQIFSALREILFHCNISLYNPCLVAALVNSLALRLLVVFSDDHSMTDTVHTVRPTRHTLADHQNTVY